MQEFEIVEVTTDLLIIGPGMAGCGACVEASHWAKENNVKIGVVDKAAMERSGAVAMGLSAINQYQGENTPVDYLSYVRQDLMGLCRDNLVTDISIHVNGTVHMFEGFGLPIWKDKEGNYVHHASYRCVCYPGTDQFEGMLVLSPVGGTGQIIDKPLIVNLEIFLYFFRSFAKLP